MISLTKTVQSQLVSLSRAVLPNEACGYILISQDLVIALPNAHPTPDTHFRMVLDARARWHIVHQGLRDFVVWHSHPRTIASPGRDDRQLFEYYPLMAIVSLKAQVPIIRCYSRDGELCSYRVYDAFQSSQDVLQH